MTPSRITQALERLVWLYEEWSASPADRDHPDQTAHWRAVLEAWEASHPE